MLSKSKQRRDFSTIKTWFGLRLQRHIFKKLGVLVWINIYFNEPGEDKHVIHIFTGQCCIHGELFLKLKERLMNLGTVF